MDDPRATIRLEEYRALRATIRERGNVRLIVAAVTFSVWAVALLASSAWFVVPVFSLIPLTVLTAGFEIVFATHVGVERIGRYIQTQFETTSADAGLWERTMAGFTGPSGGVHALFPATFIAACLINLLIAVLLRTDGSGILPDQSPIETGLFALIHLAVVGRVIAAARFAVGQRARDHAEFERLLRTP